MTRPPPTPDAPLTEIDGPTHRLFGLTLPRPTDRRLVVTLVALCAVYFLFLASLAISSHYGLKTQADDLGSMSRAVWAGTRGDLLMRQYLEPAATEGERGRVPLSRFSVHANFIFLLLVPIYAAFPSPVLLLILGTLGCVASMVGLYFIARHHLGATWLTLLPVLAFACNPLVHDANLYDFHAILLSTPLLVWCFYAFSTKRVRLAYVLLLLFLACKEETGLVSLGLGGWLLLRRRFGHGLAVIGISLGAFVGTNALMHSGLFPGDAAPVMHVRFDWLGRSLPEMAWNALTDPGRVVEHLSEYTSYRMIAYYGVLGALVCWRAWPVLLIAVPHLAITSLSSVPFMTRLTGTYYMITNVAVLAIAATCAFARRRRVNASAPPIEPVYAVAAALIAAALFSPLPLSVAARWSDFRPRSATELATLARVRERVGEQALGAQPNLGPHFAHRWTLRYHFDDTPFKLVHLRLVTNFNRCRDSRSAFGHLYRSQSPEAHIRWVEGIFNAPDYELLVQENGFYLFRKQGEPSEPTPAQRRQLDLDERILRREARDYVRAFRTSGLTWMCEL